MDLAWIQLLRGFLGIFEHWFKIINPHGLSPRHV